MMIQSLDVSDDRLVVDRGRHSYFLKPDMRQLLSVTDTLRILGIVDPTYYSDRGRIRGEKVHLATRLLEEPRGLNWESLKPIEEAIGEPVTMYTRAWERFLRETCWRSTAIELAVLHPDYLYAGTLDRLGHFPDGWPCLMDIKTGAIADWVELQTAAYSEAHPPDPSGRQRKRFTIRLFPDGDYKYYPLTDLNAGRIFTCMHAAALWKRQHGGMDNG